MMKHLKSQLVSEKAVGANNGVLTVNDCNGNPSPKGRMEKECDLSSPKTLGYYCPYCPEWRLTCQAINTHIGIKHKGERLVKKTRR